MNDSWIQFDAAWPEKKLAAGIITVTVINQPFDFCSRECLVRGVDKLVAAARAKVIEQTEKLS